MSMMTYLAAIGAAQREAMTADPRVVMIGEDIQANVFGTTGGLVTDFGSERVRNTPISEEVIVGAAAGAAMTGLRPVVDLTYSSFLYMAMDQFVNQLAKNRYMFGGQASIPAVFRSAMFYNLNTAAHHSDRPYPMFMNVPGLKIITPASPSDAKGLLRSAIACNDPVLCFEDANLWGAREEVQDDEYYIPLGVARTLRHGDDVTIVGISGSAVEATNAAKSLSEQGISAEVIDPRTLVPLDIDAVLRSVSRTGRLVVAEPAHRTCGAAAEISAIVMEEIFDALKAPIIRVTAPDMQIPFSPALEPQFYPTAQRISDAVLQICGVTAPAT